MDTPVTPTPRKEVKRRRSLAERTIPLHVMVSPAHRRYFERIARQTRATLGAAVRAELDRWITHNPRERKEP